jgi:hypothetical protein
MIDIVEKNTKKIQRLKTLCRSFNPSYGVTPCEFFRYQIGLIKGAYNDNMLLLGDFNLDWNNNISPNYAFSHYYEDLNQGVEKLSLTQLVKFTTWFKMVNDVYKDQP